MFITILITLAYIVQAGGDTVHIEVTVTNGTVSTFIFKLDKPFNLVIVNYHSPL